MFKFNRNDHGKVVYREYKYIENKQGQRKYLIQKVLLCY